jgi:predicted dehydrogenase
LIGLGHIGRVHVFALSQIPGLSLVAGCDNDPALAALLPTGVPFHTGHEALLSAGGFDTVIVATPNRTHSRIARAALVTGFDVLVEKPAACDRAEFMALLADAKATCRDLHFAFHAARAREVDWLIQHLHQVTGRYGPLTGFLCRFFDPYRDSNGRRPPHVAGLGDCWSDSGVNALSVLDRIISVDSLKILGWRGSPGHAPVSHRQSLSVQYSFPIDSQADAAGFGVIETAWDQGINHKSTVLFFGRTGWQLLIDHSSQTITATDPSGSKGVIRLFEGDRLINHYLGVFEAYVAARRSGIDNGAAARRIHDKLFEVNAA